MTDKPATFAPMAHEIGTLRQRVRSAEAARYRLSQVEAALSALAGAYDPAAPLDQIPGIEALADLDPHRPPRPTPSPCGLVWSRLGVSWRRWPKG